MASGKITFWIRLGVALGLSALFLWFALRNVDFAQMWVFVRQADHRFTALSLVSMTLMHICRVYRWEYLIRPFASVSSVALFRISSIGLMMVVLLPLRLGEFARPYLLKRETGVPMTSGLGSIVVERVIDGILVVGLFFITLTFLDPSYHVPRPLMVAAWGALAIFCAAAVAVLGALFAGDLFSRLVRHWFGRLMPGLVDRVLELLAAFVQGLRALPDVRALGMVIAWTFLYWAFNGFAMYLLMLGFGWDLPLVAGFTLVSVVVIGIMVPAGPGFLGPFQAAVILGLSVFGIPETEAAAYSLIVYPVNLSVVFGFGLPFLFASGVGMRELVHDPQELTDQPST